MKSNANHVILVNNTGCDIRDFDAEIIAAVRNGGTLPEELADLFDLKVIIVDGEVRGILNPA